MTDLLTGTPFPVGAIVQAYSRNGEAPMDLPAPPGRAAIDSGTVGSDRAVTFSKLSPGGKYWAVAQDDLGRWRWLAITGADVDSDINLGPASWANTAPFSFSVGSHYQMPAYQELVRVDDWGNLLGGKNLLGDPKQGTIQTQVFDFAFMQRHLRLATHAITLTEIADPADIGFRRFGPEDGYPYALPDAGEGTSADLTGLASGSLVGKILSIPGSSKYFTSGTAAFTNGSNQVTIANASADWVNAKMTTTGYSGGTATTTITAVDTTTGVVTLANNADVTGTRPYTIGASNLNKGARAVEGATGINFYTSEAPRDLSGNQDFAVGSMIRFTTTRKGRMSMDPVLQLTSENGVQMGLGAVMGGDTGALIQVRGYIGANERQQLSGTPTAGTFILECPATALPTDGMPIYTPTVPLAFNVTQGALQAALETVYGAGNVSVTGGPLGTAALTIEWIGALANTNIPTRLRKITTGTLTGSITVTGLEDGIPNDGTRRLLEVRAGVGVPRTADYFTVLNNEATPKEVWRVKPDNTVQMRQATAAIPVAPASCALLGVVDNGAGKQQLVVRFPSGAQQVLSTEP